MTISLEEVPESVASVSLAVQDALVRLLDHDLVAVWLYGGTTFTDRPRRAGDVDICAVVGRVLPTERQPRDWLEDPGSRPYRILAAHETIAAEHKRTIDLVCFLEPEMGAGEPPGLAFSGATSPDWLAH